MSKPWQEQNDLENSIAEGVSNLTGWADRVMEGIVPAIPKATHKGNMFAGRNEKFPV